MPLASPTSTDPDPAAQRPPEPQPMYVPPRIDAITAMLRYPLLVIIPILLLAAAGWALARKRTVTYTAQSQVLVGEPSPGTAGQLPGVVQAEQALAGIYAREIDFDGIVMPLARRFHTSPADIASRLSATPDPTSPIVAVIATGHSAPDAVALANAAGARFAKYVTSITQSNGPLNRILQRYKQAAAALTVAKANEQRLARTAAPNDPGLVQASVATQTAQLHETTLGNQYQALLSTQQNTPALSFFQSAVSATGNRTSNLEIYIFGGAVAGLLLGAALATLVANRRALRRARLAAA